MASAPSVIGVEEELQCPICIELFTHPVTLCCGHNFCWGCITEYCDTREDLGELECPTCRVRIHDKNFQPNWQMANVVEKFRRAKKDVQHINLCGKHNKELNLFCKEDEDLLCVACDRSPEHRQHTVLLLEEAAEEYKDNIQAQLPPLEQERLKLVELKVAEEQRNDNCLDIKPTLSSFQEGQLRQQLELFPGLEWRLRNCYPNSAVFEKAMEEFEGSLNQTPNKVSVTLDPDTAHLWLTLSEDLKSCRMEDKYQDLPDNPERFDTMSCVLGRERFTSGRHCWEVAVEKEGWAVGVAQESLARKGCFPISPHKGIWAVGKDSFQLWAYAYDRNAVLPLSRDLRKIRVFLDYEEGQVEFFDADTDNWMFTFTPGSFSGEGIRPFFCVGEGVHLQC